MPINIKGDQGLTLLELIVNITIISLLAAIAIPAYVTFRDKARIAQAKSDLHNIQLAIEQLANDTAQWPGPRPVGVVTKTAVWDLSANAGGLVKASKSFTNWRGPYMKSVPKDPWGNNYFLDDSYIISGTKYAVIGSFGPNGCCKNKPDSDDIVVTLTP